MSKEKENKIVELKDEDLEKVSGGISFNTQVGTFAFCTRDGYEIESIGAIAYRCDTKEEFEVSYIEDIWGGTRLVSTVYHFTGRFESTHWFVFTADDNHTVCNDITKYLQ